MNIQLIQQIAGALRTTSFYRMPASSKYHLNREGGLFQHSINVLMNLESLTQNLSLNWSRPESPVIIAMLHDACKIGAYFYNPDYKCWERNEDHPEGHGDLSLIVAEELGIQLTDEEKACIRWHMGAFDSPENWSGFTEAIHQYPNVLWVHTADMMATHVDEVEHDTKGCCFCGKPIEGYGNNAEPLKHGSCCDYCNQTLVIPAKIQLANKGYMGGDLNEK